MTKRIRVENADTSDYKVIVEVWDKGVDGQPDMLVKTVALSYPTAMSGDDLYLTSTRYVVVREE